MTVERPMFPPRHSSRRRFLSQAAGVAAGSAALALAPMAPLPAKAAEQVSDSILEAMDDSALLALEERIFEHKEAADELGLQDEPLAAIWLKENRRLHDTFEAKSGRAFDL